jgi:hypothetical protein
MLTQAAWAAMANKMASENLSGVNGAAMLSASGVLWGKSDKLVVKDQELKAIADAFKYPDSACRSGIYFAGRRFITVRATSTEVVGRSGASGVHAMKTKSCIVVGMCPSTSLSSTCALQVGRCIEWLQRNGL